LTELNRSHRLAFAIITAILLLAAAGASAQDSDTLDNPGTRVGPENGLRRGASEVGFDIMAGFGPPIFGQRRYHNMALASGHYGWALSSSWEVVGELWCGDQLNRGYGAAGGLTAHMRYHFANHGRWVPFIDTGLGLAGTEIRDGDISTTFEFNDQLGGGVQCYFRRDAAATIEIRWFHLSNLGMEAPNGGVNVEFLSAGISWYL
jgi:hypothetical protein